MTIKDFFIKYGKQNAPTRETNGEQKQISQEKASDDFCFDPNYESPHSLQNSNSHL